MSKRIIIASIWLLLFEVSISCQKAKSEVKVKTESIVENKKSIDYTSYFNEAQQYCEENNLNQELFFLIDLGVHSGLKRFFIYDLEDKKLLKSFLVSPLLIKLHYINLFSDRSENEPLPYLLFQRPLPYRHLSS